MWTKEDRAYLRVKWLQTLRRWKRLNLDSLVQSSGFIFLLCLFWYLSFQLVVRLCRQLYDVDVVGPIILQRIVSFGFLAAFMVILGGHILTAYSSLFRARELATLFSSPFNLRHLYRIQSMETLYLGGWVSGLFCLPILIAYGWELQAEWWYYPVAILGLGGFLVSAGMIGILVMLGIARWILGRPLRSAIASFLLLGFFIGVVVYATINSRILLSDVDAAQVGQALANLRLSSIPYLPSQWMSELMYSSRTGAVSRTVLYLTLLWTTAIFFWAVSRELAERWYLQAWLWAQEGSSVFSRSRAGRYYRKRRLFLWRILPRYVGALIYKEVNSFIRDFSQWGQLVLILALVLFYVAHTQNIMFKQENVNTRNQLVFFNVILLGFIQATLSLRYTFPSISLEGKAYWTVASSGIGVHRFFFTKYYLHALVLLIIGEGMAFMLNRILEADATLSLISFMVLFLFSFGFTSWSMGMGAAFHKFEAASVAEVTSDTGALVAMIVTLIYYGISIAILARFAFEYIPGLDLKGFLALKPEMIVYLTVFLLVQSAAILFPAAYGLDKLQKAEIAS